MNGASPPLLLAISSRYNGFCCVPRMVLRALVAQILSCYSAPSGELDRIIDADKCYCWGMRPNKEFVGRDWNGFAPIRWQTAGFRSIVLLRFDALAEYWHELKKDSTPDLPNDKYSIDRMTGVLRSYTTEQAGQLSSILPTDAVMHCTCGPNDCFIVPCGWVVCEKTLSATARGFRRTILTGSADDHAQIKKMQEHSPKQNPAIPLLLDLATKVAAKRVATAAIAEGALVATEGAPPAPLVPPASAVGAEPGAANTE